VASGTNTDRARQILRDVATHHPLVLDEPAPMANFEELAPGSLNLVLFAYLASLGDRSSTTNELHTEILRRFSAAGIELASPQMDVRIHGDIGNAPGTNPDDRNKERVSE
jgi:small-conductance mechanosensitive channel